MSAKAKGGQGRAGNAAPEAPVKAPLTGGRQVLLGLIGLGLVLTLFSSFNNRSYFTEFIFYNKLI